MLVRSGAVTALSLIFSAIRASSSEHPEGGGHGWPPFSDRAMEWRVRKCRRDQTQAREVRRGRSFSLVRFFDSHLRCSPFGPALPFAPSAQWASKRNELATARNGFDLVFCSPKTVKGFRLKASYFLCWCKESNQRKHQSTKRLYERRVTTAFSDSASCLDPKTAAIHGGRPPGVQKSPEVAASKVQGIKALAALRLPDQ
jgi:hypothetical protein